MQSASLLQGYVMGASLIMAIGAQNAFVLTQGLRGRHRLPIALTCAVCDAALIALGVLGAGALVAGQAWLMDAARWGGAAFLLWYGWGALRRALAGSSGLDADDSMPTRLLPVLGATLAVTLLNPHVYLDTVVLVGSLSAQQPGIDGPYWFGAGASLASLSWFLLLSFGARLLAPWFRQPLAWRVLDTVIGMMMWGLALGLLWPALG